MIKHSKKDSRIITFSQHVLKLALSVPKGRVTTYGRIARAAGGGGMASRSVTAILGKAHNAGIKNIPFHRIVYADGKFWISAQYQKKRLDLYKKEKIEVEKGKIKNFERVVFNFD
jgi:alkylated DNA nucleotide flippase Atl1